jgi:cytochrome bd-type quinol oxidase subunit 2
MNTSLALLVSVALVIGSLWARRRAQEGGVQAPRYRRLRLALVSAAIAAALLSLWSAMADHRRADEARSTGVPAEQR